MTVNASLVLNTGGSETERVHGPLQVATPVGLTERKTFTDRGLVDLNSEDAGLLEIDDFVAESESELLALDLLSDVGTRERPVEDGNGSL